MKKTLEIFKKIFVWIAFVFAFGVMVFTLVSASTFNRTDRSAFGFRTFIVLSDSMSATDFKAGDLIFVKDVDPAALSEGDIIAYKSESPSNYGEVVTHKIRTLTEDGEGKPGFITYGTTTGIDDETVVTYENILGKYAGRLPGAGRFFQFLKTAQGYFICIFLPFFLLIVSQIISSVRLFRQYRQEQQEEMNAERERQKEELARERELLENERLESQKMKEELLKLRRELSGGDGEESGSERENSEE